MSHTIYRYSERSLMGQTRLVPVSLLRSSQRYLPRFSFSWQYGQFDVSRWIIQISHSSHLALDASRFSGDISVTSAQRTTYKATFFLLCVIGVMWLTAVGAVVFAMSAFATGSKRPSSVANGSIYMSAFFLALIFNVAIVAPGLLLLQPLRLKNVLWREQRAITPRQRFRGEQIKHALHMLQN